MVDKDHLCYIQKPNPQPNPNAGQGQQHNIGLTTNNKRCKKIPDNPPIIFYFDFEAMQEVLENAQENNNMIARVEHTANLVVGQHEDGHPNKQKFFKSIGGSNARDLFCDWIFNERCGYPILPNQP